MLWLVSYTLSRGDGVGRGRSEGEKREENELTMMVARKARMIIVSCAERWKIPVYFQGLRLLPRHMEWGLKSEWERMCAFVRACVCVQRPCLGAIAKVSGHPVQSHSFWWQMTAYHNTVKMREQVESINTSPLYFNFRSGPQRYPRNILWTCIRSCFDCCRKFLSTCSKVVQFS